MATASAVACQPSSSSAATSRLTAARLARTATGPLAQMVVARRTASVSASPGSVTMLTSPNAYARSGSSGRPVSSNSLATCSGSARGARNSAPLEATSPRMTSGSPNWAVRAATIRSQASAISKPPPNAQPSTAAISGVVRRRRMIPYSPPRSVTASRPSTRSVPAENTALVPVITPAQRSGSSSSSLRAASMPKAISRSMALRLTSRRIVTMRIRPRRSVSTGTQPPPCATMNQITLLMVG